MPPKAPPPTRGNYVTLAFYATSIPLQVFPGTSDSKVTRHQYILGDDGYHPVGNQLFDKHTGALVERDNVVRCVDTDDGPVEVSDEEIEQLLGTVNGTATIVTFVPLSLVAAGQFVPEKLYQARPARRRSGRKSEVDPGAERAFGLLVKAMRKSQVAAVVNVTLRGTPHYGVLLPNARLFLVAFDDEIREELPLNLVEPTAEELEAMQALIGMHTSPDVPELPDTTTAKVTAYALEKAQTDPAERPVANPAEPTPTDLMASLEAAIAQAKQRQATPTP